ncbi:MAG: glutamate racemase [Calothrix sp. SM1_5_4]|nr:glutamate racemase [Calothrix sp. SM1_5_4]
MAAIGVFDSGVGGLTVLKALKARWPSENFIYLADTARLPYGSKSLHTIYNYVEQNVMFLARYNLKAVVVACNSASTAILERPLKSAMPIYNVVEPGARHAVKKSTRGRIGVLGTRATIYSEAYPKAIRKLLPEAQVFQQACPLWVPLVEEGWINDPITNLIVYRYLNPVNAQNVDTLIMGCTHYPVLKQSIARAAGPAVTLVDSSEGLIEDLSVLEMKEDGPEGKIQVLCTDFSPRLEETIRLLLSPLRFDSIETVDIK